MTRKTQILLATHVLALGMAYGVARNTAAQSRTMEMTPTVRTKSSGRERQTITADGEQLLAEFLKHPTTRISKYEELKATLPVAEDLKRATIAALEGRADWVGLSEGEKEKRIVLAEVRLLHWMRQDPMGAMEFIAADETGSNHRLPNDFGEQVFEDIVAENGLQASLAWLSKTPRTKMAFCDSVLVAMKQSGGLAVVDRLISSMTEDAGQTGYLAKISDSSLPFGRSVGPFFIRLGSAVRFEDRDKLLAMAKGSLEERQRIDLVEGFARSGHQAAAWLLDAVAAGELDGYVVERAKSDAKSAIRENGSVSLEQRVAIVEEAAAEDHLTTSREEVISRLVSGDVTELLKNGRDWSYEFHHGDVTADDVLTALRTALPGVGREGEPAMREALFAELVVENPGAALSLIADFPEQKRREILFGGASQKLGRADPRLSSGFLASLPEPRTADEVEWVRNRLVSQAGRLLQDDGAFVASVNAMPADAQSRAAIDVIVSETRTRNPAEADQLAKQFSSSHP